MYVLDLPTVDANTLLTVAAEELRLSDRSGLVVLQEDGAHLYHARALDLQLPTRANLPMKDIAGAVWIPTDDIAARIGNALTPEPDAVLVGTEGRRARVRFLSEISYLMNKSATTTYYCNVNPDKHYYSPAEVKQLTKAPGGVGWNCAYSDGGIVTL